jgi:DNA-binding NarL/FixJ family response regulator
MRVFIADDSPIVRARLISMLDDLDNVNIVGHARSGLEALEAIKRLRPNAVVLDIRMPGLSGIEVLEHIKQFDPRMMVIMITNFPYPQYRDRCLSAGADYFFDKSSEFHKVLEVFAGIPVKA